MTVLRGMFAKSIPVLATMGSRASLAGKLLFESIELDSEFTGDIQGWRVCVRRIEEIREGTAEDIGLTPETFE